MNTDNVVCLDNWRQEHQHAAEPDSPPRPELPPGWNYYNSEEAIRVTDLLADKGLSENERRFVTDMSATALSAWRDDRSVVMSVKQVAWLRGLIDKYQIYETKPEPDYIDDDEAIARLEDVKRGIAHGNEPEPENAS